jgi:hypothetical protein
MLRITQFDWNFSSTAESATGVLLLVVCLAVVALVIA